MKIDIHTHCIEGNIKVNDIIRILKNYSLDGICITEHSPYYRNNNFWSGIVKLNEEINYYGFFSLIGIEVLTEVGEFLVFGNITEDDIYVPSSFGFGLAEFFEKFKKDDNAIIWAHPARKNIGLDNRLKDFILNNVDGVEIFNGNHQRYCIGYDISAQNILDGFQNKIAKCGGSDAHSILNIGDCYTEFEERIKNMQDFIKCIKGKKVKGNFHSKIEDTDYKDIYSIL